LGGYLEHDCCKSAPVVGAFSATVVRIDGWWHEHRYPTCEPLD